MPGVVIEATNRLDRKTYFASIVPKHEVIEYWLAPTLSPGVKEPQSAAVTVTATALRKSLFAVKNPPLLVVGYGLGGLQFDEFCSFVQQILASCDMSAFTSASNVNAINELCARHAVIADQGEMRGTRRPVPFLMLFDRDAAARGY